MNGNTEVRIAARTAKTLALMCVRNTFLESIHSGRSPISKAGDFSDVKVIDAERRAIPWTEVSRISDDEMQRFMKQVVNRLYTWFIKTEDLGFHTRLRHWLQATEQWDAPELDDVLLRMIAQDSG
jgi:hypothetical protein